MQTKEESTEWLNLVINRWWTLSAPSIFGRVKKSLEPLLDKATPSFIYNFELKEFTLGKSTPVINSIKARDTTSTMTRVLDYGKILCKSQDEIEPQQSQVKLEMDVSLHCPDFRMLLSASMGNEWVGKNVEAAIADLNIDGKLSVTLDLDTESSFPHMAKVSVSFTERPKLEHKLWILNIQVMDVPFVKETVQSKVSDALAKALVTPSQINFNLH